MKQSLGVLSVAVLSMLTLTGCPGGSNSGPSVGVANGQINSVPNESCNVQSNYYTCSQSINGVVLTTSSVSFASTQEFCAKINDNYSQVNMDPMRGQSVARQTRQNLSIQRCSGVGQGGYPTTPGGPIAGLKTFTCQLQVKKGQSIYQGDAQQFYLPKSGGRVTLFANTMKNDRVWRFFNVSRMVNLANVTMEFAPALSGSLTSMDQIKMSVSNIDGDISASVTGFAGAENKIEIAPQDTEGEQTALIASCSSLDAKIAGSAVVTTKYQCAGTEKINNKVNKINYVNQISDVIQSGISITGSVFVQGEESTQMGAGAVNFSQVLNNSDDSTVNLKSNLSTATAISIDKYNYSLRVKCLPKL